MLIAATNPADVCRSEATYYQASSDELAIQNLMSDYNWYLETKDFTAFSCLFDAGSMLNRDGEVLAHGRAGVFAFVSGWFEKNQDPAVHVRRMVTGEHIVISEDGRFAMARSLLTTIAAKEGEPARIIRLAHYRDRFARSDLGWHFVSRQEAFDWSADAVASPIDPSAH